MAKQPAPKSVSPIEKIWLIQQFDQIDKKLVLLLAQNKEINGKLDELLEAATPSTDVTPALERAVIGVAAQAKAIDLKVPDKTEGKKK